MKIKCPSLFNEEILDAKLVEMPSFFSREETRIVIEILGKNVQIDPPGEDCVIVSASQEEMDSLENAGYTFM